MLRVLNLNNENERFHKTSTNAYAGYASNK